MRSCPRCPRLSASCARTARTRARSTFDSCAHRRSSSQPRNASRSRVATRALHNAGDAADLNGEGVEPVGLHDLRHSFVALTLDSGITLAEAAVLARHANAKVTSAIYAGVNQQAKSKIAGKLTDAGFGSRIQA
jgi:integrase